IGLLLPAGGGDPAEPGADAADRRGVPGNALVRLTPDGPASSPPGLYGRPDAGAAADGQDGPGADLSEAAHDDPAPAAPGLQVPAARPDHRPAEPGLVLGHHLHPDAPGLPVSGGGDGLGDP